MKLRKLILPAMMILSLALVGCGSKSKKSSAADGEPMGLDDMASEALEVNADSDSGKTGPIKTVRFPFNSSTLTSNAREALETNATFMKEMNMVEVQVEGHCDERGGVQYNLALGERRAKAVKNYLVSLGVDARRISTISYGKERPVAFGHDEDAWGQNRRANFVITAK